MGLDISYYSKARLVLGVECDADGYPADWENFVKIGANNDEFADRAEGLVVGGIYTFDTSKGFRAGSYSGYNAWREQLANLAGYPFVAGDDDRHGHSRGAWSSDSGPFFELIHFTDCDGVIGPTVSAKLAQDFAEHQVKADAIGGWFTEQYGKWRAAFEAAADAGFVDFH